MNGKTNKYNTGIVNKGEKYTKLEIMIIFRYEENKPVSYSTFRLS